MTGDKKATTSIDEACELIGISRSLGFKLAGQGNFPGARRLGRRYVVLTSVLERFLEGEQGIPANDPTEHDPRHGSIRD